MALEQILERVITAVEANTAALLGKSGETASTKTVPTLKSAVKSPGVVLTQDELKAAAAKVMDKHGKAFAKKLISDVGKAENIPGVKKENFAALMKAFEKALTATEADEEEDEDEDL